MRNSKFLLSTLALFGMFTGSAFASDGPSIGTVNLATCMSDSKMGKKEQENLQNMQQQMAALVENTEKELKEISVKLDDTEYLDSLSPKAEEELRNRFEALQQDMGRYQNQFYQIMQQAQYQLYQKISANIAKASEKVAKQKKLDYVVNKEVCFYIRPDLDVTNVVISEMDRTFDVDSKNKKLSDNSEDLVPMNSFDETLLDSAG